MSRSATRGQSCKDLSAFLDDGTGEYQILGPGWDLVYVSSYHCVDGRVEAECCVFGGEGLASRRHQVGVSAAGSVLTDVLQRRLTTQRCVVGFARRQKVRRLVSRHHLTCVGKDGGGEEAKGVDT